MKRERHQLVILRDNGKPIYVPLSKVDAMVASGECLSIREQRAVERRRERVTWSPTYSGGYIVMQMQS